MALLEKLHELLKLIEKEDHRHEKDKAVQSALRSSTNELLAFGYIRELEATLIYEQIVPLSIIQMIMTYYYIVGEMKIILSTTTQNGSIHTLQYIDFQQDKSILFDIQKDPYFVPLQPNLRQSCFIQNIPLPSYLHHSHTFFNEEKLSNYSAIIKDPASIIYFKTNDLYDNCKTINAFNTSLPNSYLPHHSWNISKKYREYIYSKSHGLICYDGNNLLQIAFDAQSTDAFENWKWKHLAKTPNQQCNASLCWMKKYSFESSQCDQLFICGGDNRKCATLFKINDGSCAELSSMPNARTRAAAYYDFYNQRVYIGGGGHGSSYGVDCYDTNKDKWTIYPDTLYPHSLNPILWMDGFVLFICGHQANIGCIERYDIRSNSNHWSLAHKALQIDRIIVPCEIERVLCNQY